MKNNESPLRLCVCKDRKTKYENFGISLNTKFWDFKVNKPTAKSPNKAYIEKLIGEKTIVYADKVIELKAMANQFTATNFMEKVNKCVSRKTVKDTFDLYL